MTTPSQNQTERSPGPPRQFVSFLFYQALPSWGLVGEAERERGRSEFQQAVERYAGGDARDALIVRSYSLLGLRADCDFMLWRVGYSLDALQAMAAELRRTGLGRHLRVSHSFLSMTKRSVYVDRFNPEHTDKRLQVKPVGARHLFVYPFVKTRAWYLLPQAERQRMMDRHIEVGMRYPSVRLHTSYSFGLDDQEFVVAFETDRPEDFLDLVMELRETEGSAYTLRDTPIFTCRAMPLGELLKSL